MVHSRVSGWCLTALTGICLVMGSVVPASGQETSVRFSRLGIEHGLSQGSVYAIYQDSFGLMWFGTEEGLNLFDGYTFQVFKHNPVDPESLSYNFVFAIHEDRQRDLWIGSHGGGLSRWDRGTRRFSHFRHDPEDPTSLSDDRVRVIHEDDQGQFWLGTAGGGLERFDPATGTFVHFRHDPDDPSSLSHDEIRDIAASRDGLLWVATEGGGLSLFDPGTGKSTTFRHRPDDPSSLSSDRVRTVLEDPNGEVWVGTYDAGLNRYDGEDGSFTRFVHDPESSTSISANRVRAVFRDSEGTLWVGTDGGLDVWREATGGFAHHRSDETDPFSISENRVTVIYQSLEGVLWVGTKNAGVNKFNPTIGGFVHFHHDPEAASTLTSNIVTSFFADGDDLWVGTYHGLNRLDRVGGGFTHYRHDPDDPGTLSDSRVMSILLDSSGTLWVGTLDGGLNRFDEATGSFTRFRHDPADVRTIGADGIMAIRETADGVLWVGTFGGGLNRLDRAAGSFTRFTHDPSNPSSIGADKVTSILEDSGGVLWLGTDGGGLNRFDRDLGTFERFVTDPDDPTTLSSDVAMALYEDADGTLWIGTQGAGLDSWTATERAAGDARFTHTTELDGLPNNSVYGILGDAAGNLWMSTNRGISRFDPQLRVFKNFDLADGLQSNEFNFGAYHQTSEGELFFGGNNGFNSFFPDRIRDNASVPPIVVTKFLKFNQEVDLGEPLAQISEITLGYKDYVTSFEFAALDYTAPAKNLYSYKLEGFNDEWIELGNLRRATYTNLDPGDYTFRVRGSNNEGVWNEEGTSIRLRVLPPPWKTWWAYTLYAFGVLSIPLAYARAQQRKLEREIEYSHRLESEVRERTSELAERNTDLVEANRMLEEASLTDSLTELRNRRYLTTFIHEDLSMVDRVYSEVYRSGQEPTLPVDQLFLMIDLDSLKTINDNHGHEVGDLALIGMGKILEKACRDSDTVIRWGGDEFLVVGRNANRQSAEALAERIRQAVDTTSIKLESGESISMSCSIGFAFYPFLPSNHRDLGWEQILGVADRALYIAKSSGRNAWVGLYGTSSIEDFVVRLKDDLGTLLEESSIELRSSIEDSERLVLSTPEGEGATDVRVGAGDAAR